MQKLPATGRNADVFKPEPTARFPHKPKTIHPTENRKRIDALLKRTVYRKPKKSEAQ